MKIALIYFSPTRNTAKIGEIIQKELELNSNLNIEVIDITSYITRNNFRDIKKYDFFIFGFPIYSYRAPKIIREWLKGLKGENRKASVYFTYGGVSSGIAHHNIKELLEKQNFYLISSGEFLAQHSLNLAGWKLMINRPNREDIDLAKEYAKQILNKLSNNNNKDLKLPHIDLSEKEVDFMEKMSYKAIMKILKVPSRYGLVCSMCKTCETFCPTNAMNAELGNADQNKCIYCLSCIKNCPDNVLKVQDASKAYEVFAKNHNLTSKILNSKKSRFFI